MRGGWSAVKGGGGGRKKKKGTLVGLGPNWAKLAKKMTNENTFNFFEKY